MPVDYGNLAKVLAGIAGAGFLGYCFYFDHKRRTDPEFKTKLKAKRENAAVSQNSSGVQGLDLPDMKDQESVQKFFLEEVQRGQDCLHMNNKEACVKHLTNAISVSGQPQQLLNIFKQTLPEDVYKMLIQNLAMLGSAQMAQRQAAAQQKTPGSETEVLD